MIGHTLKLKYLYLFINEIFFLIKIWSI